MRRFASLLVLPLLVVTLAACDSSTDLESVNLVGRWDGVGDLQTSDDGRAITLSIQSDVNGAISGTWVRRQSFLYSGSISGSTESGQIQFTLNQFPGTDPSFEGQLTSEHRMAGGFNPSLSNGSAVFRRGSLDP